MKPQFNKRLKRNELLDFMHQQGPNLVVMGVFFMFIFWSSQHF